jgi:hypothetical protein
MAVQDIGIVLTFLISLSALAVSVFVGFPELIGAKLRVVAQELVLIPPEGRQEVTALSPTIPFTVVNSSRASGVVRAVRLRIVHPDGVERSYVGVSEVDLDRVVRGETHKLTKLVMLGPMSPFLVAPNESVGKSLLFTLESNAGSVTKNGWVTCDYRLAVDIFVGEGDIVSSPVFKYEIDDKMLKDHLKGSAIYNQPNFDQLRAIIAGDV